MFGGDNELGNILQEAVKLKSAQMGQKRKTYETWPFMVQHTLFHGEKENFKAWRQLPFDEKKEVSERIKEEGNELFKKGSWMDAVEKYEEAATLVHYCYSTDPGWRKNNRGIDDDVIHLVEDKGSTEEDARWQAKHRAMCALNLAACKQKVGKLDEAIVACNLTLELDPDNVKALYRRAESRIRPTKATAYDHDLAIKDLAQANRIDPTNSVVEKLLARLRAERKVQREKDAKTFTGMFDRGEIYDKVQQEAKTAAASAGSGKSLLASGQNYQDLQDRIDKISDEDSLDKRVQDAELLRDLYERNGKDEEARQLNEQIKDAKKALKGQTQRPAMDWDNPTPEMIEDAKKHDLDLTDPLVIQELKRIEREGVDSLPPGYGEEEASGSASASASTCPPVEEEEEDDSGEEPIPWMRYVILFAVIFLAWCLIHSGILRLAAGRRQKPPPVVTPPEGVSLDDDAPLPMDIEEEVVAAAGKRTWSLVYEKLSLWIGGEADETEL